MQLGSALGACLALHVHCRSAAKVRRHTSRWLGSETHRSLMQVEQRAKNAPCRCGPAVARVLQPRLCAAVGGVESQLQQAGRQAGKVGHGLRHAGRLLGV